MSVDTLQSLAIIFLAVACVFNSYGIYRLSRYLENGY